MSCESSTKELQSDYLTGEDSSQDVKPKADCKPASNDEPRSSRLKLYDKVVEKSVEMFMDLASSDRFSSMFHELYKMNPARMENVNKEFVNELQRAIKDAISKLNKEAGIESKLNKLDQLESAAKNSPDPAWRPSGVPEEDFSSSIIPLYQKQEAYWQRKLKKIQAENAALAQKVKAGREKIAQTDQRISTAIAVVGSTAEWEAFSSDLKSQTSSLCPSDVLDM
nr:polyamine-modulated factor 1-like [Nerophis lumbriciformis]